MSIQAASKASTESSPVVAALGVDAVLEAVHRDLAEDRGDRAVERSAEQREPLGVVGGLLQQPLEDDRLAEDRGGLGDRQRGRELEDARAGATSDAWTPWPSSWAIVSTSPGREV